MNKENRQTVAKNPVFWIIIVVLLVIVVISANNIMTSVNTEIQKPERPLSKVRVIKVTRGQVQQWITAEGTVRSVKREFLKFEQSGKVTFIGKDSAGNQIKEGSRVYGPSANASKGQLLASIDSREQIENVKAQEATVEEAIQSINASRAALNQAIKNLEFEKMKFDRAKKLFEKEALSVDELESVEARFINAETAVQSAEARLNVDLARETSAKTQLSKAKIFLNQTNIFAPFNGIISYINIKEGEYFTPQGIDISSEQRKLETTPIVLINPNEYEITLDLPIYDGKLVNIGQEVFITWGENMIPDDVDSIAQIKMSPFAMGRIYSVNPSVSPGGRTIQAKIRTTYGAELLRDGLFVTCWVVVKEKDNALVAPYNSLIYRQLDTFTFVYDPKTKKVTKRSIKTGVEGMQINEILEGAKEGDLLVTDGRFSLVDGEPVKIIDVVGEE